MHAAFHLSALSHALHTVARGAVALALAGTTMATSLPVRAGDAVAELKTAFLYNFSLYTEWPAVGPTFGVCILGTDVLGDSLEALTRKSIAGRTVQIHRLGNGNVPDTCNVLFISDAEEPHLASVQAQLAGRPILTVVESERAYAAGAMLRLTLEQGRLTFDANPSAARNAGLRFSAKLLRLARRVD